MGLDVSIGQQVSMGQRLDRQAVIEMLASFHNRSPDAGIEVIDSLELAWLIHQVEQSYGMALDLDDDQLARMSAVAGVVEVLHEAMQPPSVGQGRLTQRTHT